LEVGTHEPVRKKKKEEEENLVPLLPSVFPSISILMNGNVPEPKKGLRCSQRLYQGWPSQGQ